MSNLRKGYVSCHYIFTPYVAYVTKNLRNAHVALSNLGVKGHSIEFSDGLYIQLNRKSLIRIDNPRLVMPLDINLTSMVSGYCCKTMVGYERSSAV